MNQEGNEKKVTAAEIKVFVSNLEAAGLPAPQIFDRLYAFGQGALAAGGMEKSGQEEYVAELNRLHNLPAIEPPLLPRGDLFAKHRGVNENFFHPPVPEMDERVAQIIFHRAA